jgi:hypothetical protein
MLNRGKIYRCLIGILPPICRGSKARNIKAAAVFCC